MNIIHTYPDTSTHIPIHLRSARLNSGAITFLQASDKRLYEGTKEEEE